MSSLPWHSASYPRGADALLVECDSLDPFLLATRMSVKHHQRATQLLEHAVLRRPTPLALYALASILEQRGTDRRRSIALYMRAAKLEHAQAAFRMGRVYETGAPGVRRNALAARAMYALSIWKQPSAEALRYGGTLLWRGAPDVMREPRRAAYYLVRAAEQFGDSESALKIGDVLIEGSYGLYPDPKRAIRLFVDASSRGSKPATLKLARIYLLGTYGVSASLRKALRYYGRAVSLGCLTAALELGNALRRGTAGLPIDPLRAVQLLETARESKVEASFALAYMLTIGMSPVKADLSRASQLFLVAVSNGGKWDEWWTTEYAADTWEPPETQRARASLLLDFATQQCRDLEAIRSLANMLLVGRGFVASNPRRACELYIRAVNETWDHRSMRAVADIFLIDRSIPELKTDSEQALLMYNRCVEFGDHLAMRDLAHLLHTGLHGIVADPEKAMLLWIEATKKEAHLGTLRCARDALLERSRFREAVDMYNIAVELPNVDPHAFTDLADLVRQDDPERAVELYRRAGTVEALYCVAEMLLWGETGNRDEIEAVRLCERVASRSERARSLVAYILERRARASGAHDDIRRARRAQKRALERDGRAFVQMYYRRFKEREDASAQPNPALLRSSAAKQKTLYAQTVANY